MLKSLIISAFFTILTNGRIFGQIPSSPKPPKVKKTESNKLNKCYLSLFEIQDADDYIDQIKISKDIKELKKLLEQVKECFSDNDLYSLLCPCILKQQEVIWLMTDEPENKIEEALKLNDITKIKHLAEEVSDDIFYILLIYNKCL